jgi:hypothetical protein
VEGFRSCIFTGATRGARRSSRTAPNGMIEEWTQLAGILAGNRITRGQDCGWCRRARSLCDPPSLGSSQLTFDGQCRLQRHDRLRVARNLARRMRSLLESRSTTISSSSGVFRDQCRVAACYRM